MPITANNPDRRSWLDILENSDFPIQNIPFGVFLTKEHVVTIGTRIGDYAIDLGALQQMGYFDGIELTDDMFMQDSLNDFISDGKKTWRLVRNRIANIFDRENGLLRDNMKHREIVIFRIEDVEMQLPVLVTDFTDFCSSKEHATNVGKLFRGSESVLFPNWVHLPVAYHGRSSCVIPSGMPVYRPLGQTLPDGERVPVFGPSKLIDFGLEMAFITTDVNVIGESVPITEVDDCIFGMVLLNDWCARDVQLWECVPLGPFLAKNFATSMSGWIVTMDALVPFKTKGPKQDPEPLSYLQLGEGDHTFDIKLQVAIKPNNGEETVVCNSNFKYLYWTIGQQLAHHTVNGCRVVSGNLMGSGVISGPTRDSFGSMLELSWGGEHPVKMVDGSERRFVEDGDTVIIRGYCENDGIRLGFGEVSSKLLPPFSKK